MGKTKRPMVLTVNGKAESARSSSVASFIVSPEEMREIMENTDWQVKEFIESEAANYFAVLSKRI